MNTPQILMINAALVAAAMIVLWLISLRLKDASIVDIFWGLGFVLIAWTTFFFASGGTRAILLATLTTFWGVRLGAYLAWRNHGKGEDSRYKEMRDHRGDAFWWFSLFSVFGLQGIVMWLVSLPVQVGQIVDSPMNVVNHLGIAVWAVGFFFEAIGDYQLARFKLRQNRNQKVMDQGLWRYTRHPNYFGDFMIWWGLFLVSVSASTLWLVVSPLVMTFLLLKVSGVALLERNLTSRSAEYRNYFLQTSAFIPWPPKCDQSSKNE